MPSTVAGNSRWTHNLTLQFVIPIAFLLIMLFLFRYFERFEFDTDEGINVMKAMLLANGYSLYTEIWSDQPPFFTHVLAVAFRIFGFDVNVARVLVLTLSCVLLWGAWRFLKAVGGNTCAFTGSLLIVVLPYYTRLSISAMVGLPALAFAMISLSTLVIWHLRRATVWLIISALALSVSVLTKAFTGFLVPIFVVGLAVSEFSCKEAHTWRERLWPATLWALVFTSVTFVLLLLFVGMANLPQLLGTHLAAREVPQYQSFSINSALSNTRATMLLALLGSLLMFRYKRWLALYPLAWSGTAYLLLHYYAPVWYHQQLLVTIPAALLAACAIGEVIRWIPMFCRSRNVLSGRGLISVVVATCVLFVVSDQTPHMLIRLFNIRAFLKVSSQDDRILEKMSTYASETQWVVTDRPMYAFRAGVLVPPHLAAISWKRVLTGTLTEREILTAIREKRPEQVLLTRFKWPLIMNYLKNHYREIYSQSGENLYLRNDLE